MASRFIRWFTPDKEPQRSSRAGRFKLRIGDQTILVVFGDVDGTSFEVMQDRLGLGDGEASDWRWVAHDMEHGITMFRTDHER